jgi:hypothetical protein
VQASERKEVPAPMCQPPLLMTTGRRIGGECITRGQLTLFSHA